MGAVARALKYRFPSITVNFGANSARVNHFDPERSARLQQKADIIVSQPVMNKDSDSYYEKLQSMFGQKLLFAPYVYFDGIFSMSDAPQVLNPKYTTIVNESPVLTHLRAHGLETTIRAYRTGNIDFQHKRRLNANFEGLRTRDKLCDIKILDLFQAEYKTKRLMITHNHPTPQVLDYITGKVAERIGLHYEPILQSDPVAYVEIVLARTETVISPWSCIDLDLQFTYDDQWYQDGVKMIKRIAEASKSI